MRKKLLTIIPVLAALGCLPAAYGNLVINPIFDGTITSDPNAATIESTINAAIAVYEARFADPITVSINFRETTLGLGENSSELVAVSYNEYLLRLAHDQTTSLDALASSRLPAGPANPVNGSSKVALTTANARALGIPAVPIEGIDSYIALNTSEMNLSRGSSDPNKFDLMWTAMHEIDEALGMGSWLRGDPNSTPVPTDYVKGMDLYRYDQNGNRSFTLAEGAQAYFSLDGTTQLARFNQEYFGDFGDFFSIGPHTPQVQDAFAKAGATPDLGVELLALDVLGYDPVSDRVPEGGATLLYLLASGSLTFAFRRRIQG